jgi:hypothetical protein
MKIGCPGENDDGCLLVVSGNAEPMSKICGD